MSYRSTLILPGVLAFWGVLLSVSCVQSREIMSLDGVWSFATDPNNQGEAQQWYQPSTKLPAMPRPGYAPSADGHICVPGIWDNQGYGTETDKVRHSFIGTGWYKREVTIPQEWNDRHVFLKMTGVCRYAKVWIDDHFLGEHIGALSIAEYEITPYITPARTVTITIAVDSKQRWEIDAMYGCSFLADYMDVTWGGIWGHVLLEARGDVWLSDLFVQTDVVNSNCTASATLNGPIAMADEARLDVFDESGRSVATAAVKLEPNRVVSPSISVKASMPGTTLWTPETPTLYAARLSLIKDREILDTSEARFGMRQFVTDGYHLLLNGKRLMLRGYGDDHVYPEQMAMPSDKQLYLARLRLIKSYGFNYVRNHSTIMPPEYYDACDEVGIICTAEFPICYSDWLPGSGMMWQKHVPAGTDPRPAVETYRREWTAVIKQYRNHPSILCWVMGNELWQGIPLRLDFQRIARQYDPARLFLDTDGVSPKILDPKNDRDTVGFYSMQFDELDTPISDKFKTPRPIKPVIAHELGNYVTFSRPDLIDRFKGDIKPFWLTGGKAKLEKLGLLPEANRWAEKSERLYALCFKQNLEALRKNPYLSGYNWWLFQDYWTSSNGIVDHFFRPKSITKQEVLKTNNDVVLLQDGLKRTYRGKSRVELKLSVSNYASKPLCGQLAWEVRLGNRLVGQTTVAVVRVPQGEVAEVGRVAVDLPPTTLPVKLKITAELVDSGRRFTNDWSSWIYPAVIAPNASAVPVLADVVQRKQFPDWGLKPIPATGTLDHRAIYLTGRPLDRRLVDALGRGARILLLGGEDYILSPRTITFKTSWWKGTENNQANYSGTLVYDNPVTRAMAPEGWCDDGWFSLLEGASKYDLEVAPSRPDVMIRALPTMGLVRDEALLFEVRVDQGRLIVSGLNHGGAAGQPENEWLVARLLEHATGGPQPRAQWPASFLSVVGSRLAGFERLISNDGETHTSFSCREDKALAYVCRQSKPGNLIAWETAPVPGDLAGEHAVIVFAGGLLGCRLAVVPGKGFTLDINGREALRFDSPYTLGWTSNYQQWESADRRVQLRFLGLRRKSGGELGLFYLTVARSLLRLGEPCRLGIRSLGGGNSRSFVLTPYTDVR